jgi:hypothetical protein
MKGIMRGMKPYSEDLRKRLVKALFKKVCPSLQPLTSAV